MKTVKLGDIADVCVSGVDKKTIPDEQPVRLCNYTDVYYNWTIRKEMSEGFMSASAKPNEIAKFRLRSGQVALTKDSETRSDIGHSAFVADDFEDVILGYHCALVTPHEEKLNGQYLNGLLRTRHISDYLSRNAGGSGQRYYLSDSTIKAMPISLPPYDAQLRIAGILGSLDEKIELNRKKIAELEALAKTIYDYWFVQFDFPDKNGKPYKSSGGKMVWNEQLKREVPEGWEVVPLVDMAAITMGQSPRGDSLNESGEGTLFFQGSSDFGDISPSNRVYTTAPTRMAKSGDILLSVRAPVGTSNIALHPCCIGRGLASLRGKECTNTFIHQALALIKSRFESKNVDGTTFGSLSKDELCNMPILKPASSIIQIFDSFVKPIETNVINLVHQIRELIILRDTLLPLLMNGQVEVG